MVDIAQLVRASDCGSEGRRFEPDYPPQSSPIIHRAIFIFCICNYIIIYYIYIICIKLDLLILNSLFYFILYFFPKKTHKSLVFSRLNC